MDKEKLKQARIQTKFEIVADSIEKINPELSLCTILVAYHGDNRNYSSISKDVFEECLWTIYGIPIVGEWVRLEEDQNKETWGSHGGRLIWDENGIKYEQTTKPFGFVTEEAYKNATWVEITEKDGHTKHEYLKLERCILWNSRYEECDSILKENFGQSMEISDLEGFYREDGYYEISKFVFSALCILGTAEPCFESAMIGRQYELNQFKNEYQLMMDAYKRLNAEYSKAQREPEADLEPQNNSINEEVVEMDGILFSEVCARIKEQIAKHIFRFRTGKQYEKYTVLSVDEESKTVVIIDRESEGNGTINHSAFKVPYVASQTKKDGLIVNIDFESKTDMVLGAVDKTESVFDVSAEVLAIAEDTSTYDVNTSNSAKVAELTKQLAELNTEYATLKDINAELEKHLSVFEKEKKAFMEQKHRDIIDTLVASRREEMGSYSGFLEYTIEIDYSKTVEDVEKELKEIHYNFMLMNTPGGKKASFSAIQVPAPSSIEGGGLSESNAIADRYGADIAKYFKN